MTGGRSPHCRRVSFRAPAVMRHKEKRRSNPPAFCKRGRRRRRPWTVQGMQGNAYRHGRDRSAPKLRHRPECFSLGVSSTWVSTTFALSSTVRSLGLAQLLQRRQLLRLRPQTLLQPFRLGVEGARNQEHSTGRTATPHRRATLQQGLRRESLLGKAGLTKAALHSSECSPLDAHSPERGGCVSPSTFYVMTTIFTMVNMMSERNIVVSNGAGA